MPIWETTPVDEVPEIRLTAWRIYETERGERHFIGWNLTEREGRVSSAIEIYDPTTQRGRTRSGRIYQLVGSSAYSADAMYVWRRWCVINEVQQARDVTGELEREGA